MPNSTLTSLIGLTLAAILGCATTPQPPEARKPPGPLDASDATTQRAADRPNIIFLLTDDQRDDSLSGMGHPYHQTPHLDALLAKSTRFANTYVASPVCSPSRVSYLTGMPERVHGVGFSSSYRLTDEQWNDTYPALIHDAGYWTGFIGKLGVEYYTFRGAADERFDWWWGHDGWTKFLPKKHKSPSCTPYHAAKADIITPIMSEAMTSFLDEAPSDTPFCLSVSFNVPHGSQTTSMYTGYPGWHTMTRPANDNPHLKGHAIYDAKYRDTDIEIPSDTATDPYRFIPEAVMAQDQGRANSVYDYNYTRPTNLEHHIRYAQTIEGLDRAVGDLMEQLERRGLADDTIIIFASDHGLLMGEYGMGGKALLYDLTAKIPCFIHDPGSPSKGQVRQELVSGTDLTRTMLDYAGVSPAEFMDGRSLRPLVNGQHPPWRSELFLESLFTLRDTPFQEGVRRDNWKYVRMYDGVKPFDEDDVDFRNRAPDFELLFDLDVDPAEQHNLIDSPPSGAPLDDLRQACARHSEALNDQRKRFQQATATERR